MIEEIIKYLNFRFVRIEKHFQRIHFSVLIGSHGPDYRRNCRSQTIHRLSSVEKRQTSIKSLGVDHDGYLFKVYSDILVNSLLGVVKK